MTAAEAAARLARMVASTEDPVLSAAALTDLLLMAQRPDDNGNLPTNVASVASWAASTLYAPGAVVQPTPAVSRWWICLIGGTSGTTQPSWPDLSGQARTEHTVGDNYVTWIDAGAAWTPTYDLAAAAVEGWEQKAGLAASRYQFATDGQAFMRQQVIAHCQAQADRYRRKTAAAIVEPC